MCASLPRRSAYVRRPRLARVPTTTPKDNPHQNPRRTRAVSAAVRHHPSTAYCPVDSVLCLRAPPEPPPLPSPSVRTPAAHGVSRNLPRRSPRADLHPKKICNLGPIGPCPRQIRNHPRAPSSRRSGLVGPHTTPPIVHYKYMTSTLREGYFWLPTLGT